MRKKRIMIVGAGRSGKTTLANFLEGGGEIRRIPNMVYRSVTLDTPGPYLESPWMQNHLIAAAQDASCILMLADASGVRQVYPPEFAKAFRVPIFGVITKCDHPDADREAAAKDLMQAGVSPPYYEISVTDPGGMECLKEALLPFWPVRGEPTKSVI